MPSKATIDTNLIEEVVVLYNMITKIWDREIFAKNNITILQFNILGTLIVDKSKTINDIKKRLIVSSASLSQTINRMEKAGFISRVYGKGDRREVNIDVKPLGKETYIHCNEIYLKLSKEKLSGMPSGEKEKLLNLLRQLSEVLK